MFQTLFVDLFKTFNLAMDFYPYDENWPRYDRLKICVFPLSTESSRYRRLPVFRKLLKNEKFCQQIFCIVIIDLFKTFNWPRYSYLMRVCRIRDSFWDFVNNFKITNFAKCYWTVFIDFLMTFNITFVSFLQNEYCLSYSIFKITNFAIVKKNRRFRTFFEYNYETLCHIKKMYWNIFMGLLKTRNN